MRWGPQGCSPAGGGAMNLSTVDLRRAFPQRASAHVRLERHEAVRWSPVIAAAALLVYGAGRRDVRGAALFGLGALLFGSAASRAYRHRAPVRAQRSITIARSAADLYRFWRDFETLPRFMHDIQRVEVLGDRRARWAAVGEVEPRVEWVTEIIDDTPHERIAWRSVEPAEIEYEAMVTFAPAFGERGTEVRLVIDYHAPVGPFGRAVAAALGDEPAQRIAGDLQRLKRLMETGDVITVRGQPSGRAPHVERRRHRRPKPRPVSREQEVPV